ncbi:MAG TPA: hypothetical protein VI299_07445 [Polyangiales bacterium]
MSKLSKPVQDFLRERIDALEQLEVLFLLRENPELWWEAKAVADALQIDLEQACGALEQLRAHALLLVDDPNTGRYRFCPRDAALATQAGATADAYRHARIDVLTFVSRGAMDRIRSAQLRTFAQAFLLRDPSKKDRR